MKKALIVFTTATFVALVMACGGLSNEEACNKYKSTCESSTTSGDGGASASVKVTCDPNGFDKMSNDSDVKDCIDKAADCSAATQCLLTAKPK
jgi:hypothetical protein